MRHSCISEKILTVIIPKKSYIFFRRMQGKKDVVEFSEEK